MCADHRSQTGSTVDDLGDGGKAGAEVRVGCRSSAVANNDEHVAPVGGMDVAPGVTWRLRHLSKA